MISLTEIDPSHTGEEEIPLPEDAKVWFGPPDKPELRGNKVPPVSAKKVTMETYPATSYGDKHWEPPLNSAMSLPYNHAVESDGEDDYLDPMSRETNHSQTEPLREHQGQTHVQRSDQPYIKSGYAIKSAIQRTIGYAIKSATQRTPSGNRTGSPTKPRCDSAANGKRRSARTRSRRDPTSLESQLSLAAENYNRYQLDLITMRSSLGGKGLFSRKDLPAGYEIDYYGEYFASIDELIEAGQDDSVGDPRGCLGAPGTPLPEDIKDINKILGGFLGAP